MTVTLPAGSSASTEKVCEPSDNAESELPEVHAANGEESTEHSKVAVPSVDENVKLGVASFELEAGLRSSDHRRRRVS